MFTPRKIAVAGATGRVGHHVVDVLKNAGHEVVPIARSSGVDVVTGKGLKEALAGVTCVIDAASGPSPQQEAATAFFTAAARNLQEFGARAGAKQMVVVSIIGIDRFTAGYNAAKQVHERVMQCGPIPVRIVRAAQFHEFVPQIMAWATKDDVCYVPRMRTQLVAARTVAEALADLATGPASGPTVEIAGPRAENLAAAAKLFATLRGMSVRIEEVSNPADPDSKLYETGALLPGPGATLAGPTFEQWLDSARSENLEAIQQVNR